MSLNDIKHLAVERIWLVPMAEDGELGYVWCDDPAPGAGMDPEDAIEYVRKDSHDSRVAELEQERDALAAHVDQMSAAISDALPRMPASEARAQLRDAYNETPETILARRDLIKGAEALERLYDQSSQHMVINRGSLINRARNLRQQAKELSDD